MKALEDIYRYIVMDIYRYIVGDILRYVVGNIYRYIVGDILNPIMFGEGGVGFELKFVCELTLT